MDPKLKEALAALSALNLPRAQQNERSALCLLALLDLAPETPWSNASAPLLGITPIMEYIAKHYGRRYAPNTRETVRRQTMHQFVDAGIARYNPDDASRPVNSPKAVYQVTPEALDLFRLFGRRVWSKRVREFLDARPSLQARYAKPRVMARVPVTLPSGAAVELSPGTHNALTRQVVEEFAPRFAPGANVAYIGDTEQKHVLCDAALFESLGVVLDGHGKMPDVVMHEPVRNWLLLIECVSSHGPVDGKRHMELTRLFGMSTAGLVFVTAFPNRALMARYLVDIAWETEVWCADAPTHLIHFNGERFLGPY